ncbi:hypothetical protein LCGC14_2124700, partial [marine sediment metagenome]
MSDISDLFIPKGPVNQPIFSLDKGIILDKASNRLPIGAMVDVRNYIAGPNGLKRRPAIDKYTVDTISYPYLQGIVTFWKTDGTQVTLAIDSKFLYVVSNPTFTSPRWSYVAGSLTMSGAVATGNGTAWNTAGNELRAGDIIILDLDASGDGPETIEIASIDGATTLTLVSTPVGTYGAGTDYAIRRAFGAANPYLVDFAIIPGTANKVLFADSIRFLYSYDGTTFTDYNATENDLIPSCVAYFQDRVWIAHIVESSNDYRQRIRWSRVDPNHDDFTATGSGYQDLPYTQGAIKRLVPMSNMLVVYFDDALFVGRPGNSVANPLGFQQVETGEVGLVGPKAVCRWLGGHFFVGQDDIYFFSNRGFESIGMAVVKKTIRECQYRWRIFAVADPINDRIVFGFPKNSEEMQQLWSYNYKSKSWSYDEITCTCLRSIDIIEDITWSQLHAGSGGVLTGARTGTVDTGSGKTIDTAAAVMVKNTGSIDWVTDGVIATDIVILDVNGGAGGPEEEEVLVVDSPTQITLAATPAIGPLTAEDYQIVRPTWTDLGTLFPTWEAIKLTPGDKQLYLGKASALYTLNAANTSDEGGGTISALLETGDLDYNKPDQNKFWNKLSLKTEETLNS